MSSTSHKVTNDIWVKNVLEGKADVENLLHLFKKEPGRSIRLLKEAKSQLVFLESHPDILKRNPEKRERLIHIMEVVKEEIIDRQKKATPMRTEPERPSVPMKSPEPLKTFEPVKPTEPEKPIVIKNDIPIMTEKKEPMSFREEFAELYKKEIDFIRCNLINPPTTEQMGKRLLKTIEVTKGLAEPQDTPLYKVIEYIATHKSEIEKIKEKKEAIAKIAEALNYTYNTVHVIFYKKNIKLPEHLNIKKYNKKTKEEPPDIEPDKKIHEEEHIPPYDHAVPPKDYLSPVGKVAKPIETVIIKKSAEEKPAVVAEETKTIDATKAKEIVIKAQGVEIVIRMNGSGISIGKEAEIPKEEPVAEKIPDGYHAAEVRYTARNRPCFCYGCGENIMEPTVAIVRLRLEDEKLIPFHVMCTEPGNVVKFSKMKKNKE